MQKQKVNYLNNNEILEVTNEIKTSLTVKDLLRVTYTDPRQVVI